MVKSASLTDLLGDGHCTSGHQNHHSGGLGVWYNTKSGAVVKGEETDFIATSPLPLSHSGSQKGSIFPKLSKLVYSIPTDSLNDITEEKKSLPIRHGLLRAHPRIRMLTTHRDAHIYIFPRWILEFVKENERLQSIGEDVVGWWAKAGWQAGLADKLQISAICNSSNPGDDNDSNSESDAPLPPTSSEGAGKQTPTGQGEAQSTKQDGSAKTQTDRNVPPVIAYVHSTEGEEKPATIRRVDTAQLLLAISLQLAKLESIEEVGPESASPFAHSRKVAYPEGVKPRTTITKQDSLIAENVTVEEKTAIKESVVGANCQINEGAKLSQCLLMDGVVIGKGCKLTKCILGKRCVIGDYSVLTDCEVQENLMVEARSESFPPSGSYFGSILPADFLLMASRLFLYHDADRHAL
jgi:translation initiation factor eIF-2B subunit gamma